MRRPGSIDRGEHLGQVGLLEFAPRAQEGRSRVQDGALSGVSAEAARSREPRPPSTSRCPALLSLLSSTTHGSKSRLCYRRPANVWRPLTSSSAIVLDKNLDPHKQVSFTKFAKLRKPATDVLVADEVAQAILKELRMPPDDDEAAAHAKNLVAVTARHKYNYWVPSRKGMDGKEVHARALGPGRARS